MWDDEANATLAVDENAVGGVVDGVDKRRARKWSFLPKDLVPFGDLSRFFRGAAKGNEARVKGLHVGLEHGRRIAFRIQGYKQDSQLVCAWAKLTHDFSLPRQMRRANVWAMGKTEEQADDLAPKLGQRSRRSELIGEGEVGG